MKMNEFIILGLESSFFPVWTSKVCYNLFIIAWIIAAIFLAVDLSVVTIPFNQIGSDQIEIIE